MAGDSTGMQARGAVGVEVAQERRWRHFEGAIQPIRFRLERGDEESAVKRRLSQKRAMATPRGAIRVRARKRTHGILSPRAAARMAVPPAAATATTAIVTSSEAMESLSRGG